MSFYARRNSQRISFNCTQLLRSRLEELAAAQGETLSATCNRILENHMSVIHRDPQCGVRQFTKNASLRCARLSGHQGDCDMRRIV